MALTLGTDRQEVERLQRGLAVASLDKRNTQRRQRSTFPTGCKVLGSKRVIVNSAKAQFEPLGHTKPALMS